MLSTLLLAVTIWLTPAWAGQELPPPPRVVGITHGLGATHGLASPGLEVYFLNTRLSALVGYGPRLWGLESGMGSGMAFTTGLRGYLGGERHRAFGLIAAHVQRYDWTPQGVGLFGLDWGVSPTVTAGYHLVAGSGFTVFVGAGLGHFDQVGLFPTLDFGLGYTLRAWWKHVGPRAPLEDPPKAHRRRSWGLD